MSLYRTRYWMICWGLDVVRLLYRGCGILELEIDKASLRRDAAAIPERRLFALSVVPEFCQVVPFETPIAVAVSFDFASADGQ